jgi:hypothetical protein
LAYLFSAYPFCCVCAAAQKQEIQEAMNRGNSYEKSYDECVDKAVDAWTKGNGRLSRAWLDAARAWQGAIKANRELIILLVDIAYGISAPPGTTFEYDPNSRSYGATSGSKGNIKVRLCSRTFDDGPGLVASTKIHELEHAWQIHWCWSDFPGFWDDCTFWGHFTE